jgi:Adenosine-deaminase (editase) domain
MEFSYLGHYQANDTRRLVLAFIFCIPYLHLHCFEFGPLLSFVVFMRNPLFCKIMYNCGMVDTHAPLLLHRSTACLQLDLPSMAIERTAIASHVHSILQVYSSIPFSPPASQYTIAASFFLTHSSSPNDCKVISVATGTKCLPTARLPFRGEAVHDSHAEVLARRGALRWFLEEIGRCHHHSYVYQSDWICQSSQHGQYELRDGVQIHLYVSTVPCTIIEYVFSE